VCERESQRGRETEREQFSSVRWQEKMCVMCNSLELRNLVRKYRILLSYVGVGDVPNIKIF
jgi:hypothetical protein